MKLLAFKKRVKAKHAFLTRTFLSFSAKKMSQFQSQMLTTPTGHSYTQQVNVFHTKFPLKIVSSNLNKMSDFKHVDYGNHLTELQMGVVFNETADGHGDTSNLCIQLSYNKFHCWMNSTSWKIESETDYFGDTFVTKSMNRFVLIFLTNRVITPNIFQSL